MRAWGPGAFDPAVADDLCAILGRDGVDRLMASFAAELADRPATIVRLASDGDAIGARFQAHYLKGAALSIGAGAVAAACDALEHGADRDLPHLAQALATCAGATLSR